MLWSLPEISPIAWIILLCIHHAARNTSQTYYVHHIYYTNKRADETRSSPDVHRFIVYSGPRFKTSYDIVDQRIKSVYGVYYYYFTIIYICVFKYIGVLKLLGILFVRLKILYIILSAQMFVQQY